MTERIEDSPALYCREVEAYLCRKNDGHLIRIVGPAFEQVCAWAGRGVPLKLAFRGIDRYFERYYAKGPRRRPVRVEFCEADVLDVFDEWRRAVGVTDAEPGTSEVSGGAEASSDPPEPKRHGSLPSHLDRTIARLTSLRAGETRTLDPILDAIIRELDSARASSKALRGEARKAFVDRLRDLDDSLLNAAREQCEADALDALGDEANAELAPFRGRMPRDAFAESRRAAVDRLVRERFRLPVLSYDE